MPMASIGVPATRSHRGGPTIIRRATPWLVAAADPERGEAIARSIEDAARRSSTLVNLARLLAQVNS